MIATSSMMAGGIGFLHKITRLEFELNALKEKFEKQSEWKNLLEDWILLNFAFDLREVLNSKSQRGWSGVVSDADKSRETNKLLKEDYHQQKLEKGKRSQRLKRPAPVSEKEQEEKDFSENIVKVDVEEFDMICENYEEDFEDNFLNEINPENPPESENENEIYEYDGNEEADSEESETESKTKKRSPRKRNKYTPSPFLLIKTYPSMKSLKSQFKLQEWAVRSKDTRGKLIRVNYYCRQCGQKGLTKLQLRYLSENDKVELWKNTAEHVHDHGGGGNKTLPAPRGPTTLTEEIKQEIVTLYKEGIKTSTQILKILKIKISKEGAGGGGGGGKMVLPTQVQVINILKPYRTANAAKSKSKTPKAASNISIFGLSDENDTSVE